jgi:hypothetical protein
MPSRWRTLIGGVGMLVFLAAYMWLAATVFGYLPKQPWVQLAYMAVAGILWGVPLFPLISWMSGGRQ